MTKLFIILLRLIITISGFYLLGLVDWKILLGVFLLIWSNNIDQNSNKD